MAGWTTCPDCKEKFALNDSTEAVLRKSRQTFHCPWGHQMSFRAGPREEDLLRKALETQKQQNAMIADDARRARERAEQAERRASAARGQVTRLKNRAAAGVCPCCNRTFANLQRHMAGKHPTFLAEEVAPEDATIQ